MFYNLIYYVYSLYDKITISHLLSGINKDYNFNYIMFIEILIKIYEFLRLPRLAWEKGGWWGGGGGSKACHFTS